MTVPQVDLRGCLFVLLAPVGIVAVGMVAVVLLGTLAAAPVTTTVVGVLAIGSTIAIRVSLKRSRGRKELAMQQQHLALQQAQAHQEELVRQAQIAEEERRRQQQFAEEEWRRRQRYEQLAAQFRPQAAGAIMARQLWVGATEPIVVAMFGSPDDVEARVLKTKSKRVLKYRDVMHAGRYSLKVTIENGAVIGWDDKR